jgi:hypothetical protein
VRFARFFSVPGAPKGPKRARGRRWGRRSHFDSRFLGRGEIFCASRHCFFLYFLVQVNFLATSGAPERFAGDEITDIFLNFGPISCSCENPVLENVNNLLPNTDSAVRLIILLDT